MKIQKVIFKGDCDARCLSEARDRGYLNAVFVISDDSACYSLLFFDPSTLTSFLDGVIGEQDDVLAHPELVVVSEVTLDEIKKAIHKLEAAQYFNQRVPITGFSISDDDLVISL